MNHKITQLVMTECVDDAIRGCRARKLWTVLKIAVWIMLTLGFIAATIFSAYVSGKYLSSIAISLFMAILSIIGGSVLSFVSGVIANHYYNEYFKLVMRIKELENILKTFKED